MEISLKSTDSLLLPGLHSTIGTNQVAWTTFFNDLTDHDKIEPISSKREERIIPIRNINSKKIALKEPLLLNLSYLADEDEYLAESTDLNIWGHGATEHEALLNFSQDLENLYLTLNKNKDKLGQEMERIWIYLKSVVEEKR